MRYKIKERPQFICKVDESPKDVPIKETIESIEETPVEDKIKRKKIKRGK